MGNTWITDLTHFLTKDGGVAPMPGPARRLADFLGNIVVHASTESVSLAEKSAVPCRRRPKHKACPGTIKAAVDFDTDEILWACPVCRDNGIISNWRGSLWDCGTDAESH